MDPQLVCKKSLTLPYQQSFRIDDLLTPKAIEQQPDHFSHHHHHTSLQPPPSGLGVGVACLEKTFPEEQKSSGMENTMMCQAAAMSIGQASESNYEIESKTPTKRSYSSTSNEDEDEMYRKRKKARTAFSREQVSDLEKKFLEKKYLSSAERGELAERLKLSDMQVKTWFQNRRMKFKRQSEEAEMEMKSPKFPYSSFMPYGGVSSFYSYVPMPYKSHDSGSVPYTYGGSAAAALRSPQTSSINAGGGGGMEASNFVMNSPTMLGSLSSPLSTGMSPRLTSISTPISRSNGTSSYFNGLLTPISPSTGYQHGYFGNEGTIGSGSLSNHTQVHGFSEWPRAIPAPTTP